MESWSMRQDRTPLCGFGCRFGSLLEEMLCHRHNQSNRIVEFDLFRKDFVGKDCRIALASVDEFCAARGPESARIARDTGPRSWTPLEAICPALITILDDDYSREDCCCRWWEFSPWR